MIELKTNSTNVTVFAPTGETIKDTYNKGYKEGEFAGELSGYAEGKEVGYSEGYGEGYSSGTQAGFSDGHSIGYTNGWDDGYEQGYDTGFIEGESIGKYNGYKDGYDKGMSAGIAGGYQEYYDTIWDYSGVNTNPDKGAVNYDYFFAGGLWNDTTFNPKYDIKPTSQNVTGIFHNSRITDLKAILEARGKEMYFLADGNTSKCKYLYTLFAGSTITHIPALKFHARNFEQVFKNCKNLHTIDEFDMGVNGEYVYQVFEGCTALQNVVFKGVLKCNNMNVSACPLTKESLLSLLNILKDNSTTGTKNTVTLGATNLAKLTDAEIAKATQKGWTIA